MTRILVLMATLVLFDIGGVQLQLDYHSMFNELGRLSGTPPEDVKSRYVASGIEDQFMRGRITTDMYRSSLGEMLGIGICQEELKRILNLSWDGASQPVLDVKRDLMDRGYPVGNFSNISVFARGELTRRYREIFKSDESYPGVYSYMVGEIKPHPAMYRKIVDGEHDGVVFIDDNRSYVSAGVNRGWNGIHFTPYVDHAEAVRSSQKDMQVDGEVVTADSVDSLVSALKGFGLKF